MMTMRTAIYLISNPHKQTPSIKHEFKSFISFPVSKTKNVPTRLFKNSAILTALYLKYYVRGCACYLYSLILLKN